MNTARLVTLLTDFGPASVYVGQMHGVLARRAPEVRVIDLAHDCPPGGVAAAAYLLGRSYDHFPDDSVHVAVIDPGVGSARRILAARAHGHVFLAPDNGLLGEILAADAAAAVHSVENRSLMSARIASTFHGRDVFAPVAAWLARGGDLAAVGPATEAEIARPGPEAKDDGLDGRVLLIDRFGNLITNVPRTLLETLGEPTAIRVRVGTTTIDGLVQTFTDVARDDALCYVGSGEHLEIAVNGGRACDRLGVGPGAYVRLERSRR